MASVVCSYGPPIWAAMFAALWAVFPIWAAMFTALARSTPPPWLVPRRRRGSFRAA